MDSKTAGIVGYGIYFPGLKISAAAYHYAWGGCAARIKEKTVMDVDEDPLTMAVEAGREVLRTTGCPPDIIQAFAVASTTFPYQEKLNSSTVAAALGLPSQLFVADYSNSTRAASTALINMAAFMLSYGSEGKGMLIASDAPEADLQEEREHGLGAGAAALLVGTSDLIAELEGHRSSYLESLGERFTRRGRVYLEDIGVGSLHAEMFNRVTAAAVEALLQDLGLSPEDYTYLCVGEHNPRLTRNLGRRFGFKDSQMQAGSTFERTGDLGAAAPLVSLAAVLEVARPGERVLLISYGSGAGADALSFKITEAIERRRPAHGWRDKLEGAREIDYIQYLKLKKLLVR